MKPPNAYSDEDYRDFLLGKKTLAEPVILDANGKPLNSLPACPLARSIKSYERCCLAIIHLSSFLWQRVKV